MKSLVHLSLVLLLISCANEEHVSELKDGQTNGEITLPWPQGGYRGEIKDGKPHGYGLRRAGRGSKYTGEFRDGVAHGQGTFVGFGLEYVGEWKDSNMHGRGTLTFPKLGKYVGEWKDDKKHGQGTETLANGEVRKGEWRDGEFIGSQ